MPTESQGTRSRSGGMSVSLASPDGRVVGGGVAGLLVAASPVQVTFFFSSRFSSLLACLLNVYKGSKDIVISHIILAELVSS